MLTNPLESGEPDKSIIHPRDALEDRKMLGVSIPTYRFIAASVMKNELIRTDGSTIPLKQTPRKILKNYARFLSKHEVLRNSLVYKELHRRIVRHLIATRNVKRHPSELYP